MLRPPHSHELAGVILTSLVAPRVAHITQICVMPGYQRHGIGRRLMESAIDALRMRGVEELSLTVTAANERAVRLYCKYRIHDDQDVYRRRLASQRLGLSALLAASGRATGPFSSFMNSLTSLKSR